MAIDAARQTAAAPIDERVREAAGRRPGADDSNLSQTWIWVGRMRLPPTRRRPCSSSWAGS
jgi:hypothetical protein